MTRTGNDVVELDLSRPVWEQCFTVAPLIVVGTRDPNGACDFAPKHMVTPMGWQNYFGFVCSPTHTTCRNIERTSVFTVSFPTEAQLLFASLAASPRGAAGEKPVVQAIPRISATRIDGDLVRDSYLFLECEHFKTVSGFGENCLITGTIVAARAEARAVRSSDVDEQELIHAHPLLAYLSPGRFATIDRSNGFPFPVGMKK